MRLTALMIHLMIRVFTASRSAMNLPDHQLVVVECNLWQDPSCSIKIQLGSCELDLANQNKHFRLVGTIKTTKNTYADLAAMDQGLATHSSRGRTSYLAMFNMCTN